MKADNATAPLTPAVSLWQISWAAIRPRTLSIAIAPVLLGTALAWADGSARHWITLWVTLACALLIQIGTNLHNDVIDFERGTDRPDRVGPLRVTAAGWVSSRAMHRATGFTFGLALLLGAYLVALGGWPILLAGVLSLLAGWSYSGGSRPVSHTAFGEVFVLVFFGLVAVAGSHWLQSGRPSLDAWLCGGVVGLPAAAVLLVNNYRDLESDLQSGRRTLAARVGRAGARSVFFAMLLLPFVLVLLLAWRGRSGTLLTLLALPLSTLLAQRLRPDASADSLNVLLAATAKLTLLLAVLLSLGVFL